MENREVLRKITKIAPYLAIVLLAVVARLIPHPPNFVPIGGLALFSGFHFKKKSAVLIPLVVMLISDIFLGFHNTIVYVYVSFLLMVLIGRMIKNNNGRSLILASLISSSLFFLITNFGVWINGSMYPKTIDGLIQSYVMGLPFFRNTLLSDLVYSFSFFYGFRYLDNVLLKRLLT